METTQTKDKKKALVQMVKLQQLLDIEKTGGIKLPKTVLAKYEKKLKEVREVIYKK